MLSESPLPPNASLTIAVLRCWICKMRRSMVSETCRENKVQRHQNRCVRAGPYNEMFDIDRPFLAYSMNAIDCLVLDGRVPPAVHLRYMDQHATECKITTNLP